VRGATVTTGGGSTTDTGLLPGQTAAFDGISLVSSAAVSTVSFRADWQADEAPAISARSIAWTPAATALVAQRASLVARLNRLIERRSLGTPSATDDEIALVGNALEEITAQIETLLGAGF
jgi:hypothetical protein